MTTTDGASRRATIAMTLLVLINLFNYIDRQVLAAVESSIETSIFPVSSVSHQKEMGSLVAAFMVSYMLIAPLFGYLADRMSRWLLIGIGVVVWSLASGASGLAGSFSMLFLTRCLVGFGEAAYGPVAPTVISDLFPVAKRGLVMALFYMAIPVGSALGYVLGGQVTALTGDWRWAFYVVVPPGLLLGVWCFLMRDPPRGGADGATARQATWNDYILFLKTPSYVYDTLGMTAMTFAMGGIGYYMPRFARDAILPDRLPQLGPNPTPQMVEELTKATLAEVSTYFGIIVVVSGLGATIAGGLAGDKLKTRFPGAYFLVSAIAMGTAFPLILASLWTPFPTAWIWIFFACFCLFFNTGPTNTILANVTHPSVRASAFAVNILIIHALGDAISPYIIGAINDYNSGDMKIGFVTVSVMCLVASLMWFLGMPHLQRDTELASTRLSAP